MFEFCKNFKQCDIVGDVVQENVFQVFEEISNQVCGYKVNLSNLSKLKLVVYVKIFVLIKV